MAAYYDHYDYPSYWIGRQYEHEAESLALKSFLNKIPAIKTTLEIGAGFGRLTKIYLYRSKKVILSDPSARLLKIARNEFNRKKVVFIQSTLENIPTKIKPSSLDLVILVRVLHHIKDFEKAFKIIYKILAPNKYFILEFANKQHFKAKIIQFIQGNLTFPLDIFPKDIRKKTKTKKTLPFINYHPEIILKCLKDNGFEVEEIRSVSNIRANFLKRFFSLDLLLFFEKILQKPLAKIFFGPSVFILARKRG